MVGLAQVPPRSRPYRKQLYRSTPRGVVTDLPAWSLPPELLSQANNAVFRRGIAQRGPLLGAAYDPPSVGAYMLHNVQIDGVNYWVLHGDDSSYVVETSNWYDVTHASGLSTAAANWYWTVGTLNGVPFANNGLDAPMYWDGNVANKFVDLPDFPTANCVGLYSHRYHLIAIGPTDLPEQVAWSDAADPGSVPSSWTAASDNEAGTAELADTPGALVTAGNLRGSFVLYKPSATHIMDYVGGEEIYSFRTLFVQAGCITRHGHCDINGLHFVVSDGDVVLHDGVNIKSVVNRKRKQFLFNQLDSDNYEKLFTVYHRSKNEVWLCFPETGETLCTRAMIYDVSNGHWGDRDLPGISMGATGIVNDLAEDQTWDADDTTWDTDVTTWNELNYQLATRDLLMAEPATPDLYRADAGSTAITTTLARHSIPVAGGDGIAKINRVFPRVEGDTDIDFALRIGVQDSPEGATTWTNAITFNSNDNAVSVIAKGRYISWEVSATTAKAWALTGMDFEFYQRGYN